MCTLINRHGTHARLLRVHVIVCGLKQQQIGPETERDFLFFQSCVYRLRRDIYIHLMLAQSRVDDTNLYMYKFIILKPYTEY